MLGLKACASIPGSDFILRQAICAFWETIAPNLIERYFPRYLINPRKTLWAPPYHLPTKNHFLAVEDIDGRPECRMKTEVRSLPRLPSFSSEWSWLGYFLSRASYFVAPGIEEQLCCPVKSSQKWLVSTKVSFSTDHPEDDGSFLPLLLLKTSPCPAWLLRFLIT